MNGRAYDYNLGRFLSIDPVIQAPGNSQSLNPYSYIMNNPLAGVDPSGYVGCDADSPGDCNAATSALDKGDTANITQKQTVTGSRIKQSVKVGSITGNGNGTVSVKTGLGSFKASADIGSQASRGQQEPGQSGQSSPDIGRIEAIEGNVYNGIFKSYANALTLGILYGDVSQHNWLNADPIDSADMEAYMAEASTSEKFALNIIAPGRKVGSGLKALNAFDIGLHKSLKGSLPGFDSHHVGQAALMRQFIPGYDRNLAPAILVPKVGHTVRDIAAGIVSRSTKGFTSARQVVARDVRELRRVYSPPNSQLQKLINMNKSRLFMDSGVLEF